MDEYEPYCETPEREAAGQEARTRAEGPFAECVLCRAPTEYPETVKGATLRPVCEWREAERTACSG